MSCQFGLATPRNILPPFTCQFYIPSETETHRFLTLQLLSQCCHLLFCLPSGWMVINIRTEEKQSAIMVLSDFKPSLNPS